MFEYDRTTDLVLTAMNTRPLTVIKRSDAVALALDNPTAKAVVRRPKRNIAATISEWILECRELRQESHENDLIAFENALGDRPDSAEAERRDTEFQ